MIKLNLILKHFYTDEKLFELFCIKNDFAKYFAKYRNLLFKYFVSHIMIIFRSDTFLYHRTNQVSLRCIIVRNGFVAPE